MEVLQLVDKSKDKTKEDATQQRFDKLEKRITKTDGNTKEDFAKQIATRAKLERDYKEDYLHVTFNSSPETRRTIQARKPNQKEFLDILSLSIEASRFEGKLDANSLAKMKDIYAGLHKMAANLCVDKMLDFKFWSERVSFNTLQNFISELIIASQKGTGVTEAKCPPFVENNLGYLEYEMCSLLHITPRQLGKLRQDDPVGIAFLERTYIYRINEQNKAHKKQEQEAKRKRGRRR